MAELYLMHECMVPCLVGSMATQGQVTAGSWTTIERISRQEAEVLLRAARVPEDQWEAIFEDLSDFHSLWNEYRNGNAGFDESNFEELRKLGYPEGQGPFDLQQEWLRLLFGEDAGGEVDG